MMFTDTPQRRQPPSLTKPKPAAETTDQTEILRRDIATQVMIVMLGSESWCRFISNEAVQVGTKASHFLAWQAFFTADAMIAESQRSPADRAAQNEAWVAASKGRTA